MAMRLPITLAILLVLWAVSETGLCLTPCPSHCTARFGVAFPEGPKLVQGPDASLVIEIIDALENLEPGVEMAIITIDNKKVKVPSKLKSKVKTIIKEHPTVSKILWFILVRFKPKNPPKGGNGTLQRPGSGSSLQEFKLPSYEPKIPLPPPNEQMFMPPGILGVNDKIRFWLELLLNQPNYFPVIYQALIKLGVVFKNLNNPIQQVYVGQKEIQLPRPVVVKYVVQINDQIFDLPREADRLTVYVSKHPEHLVLVVTLLKRFGATFSTNGQGMLTGFILFNVTHNFKRALGTQISVGDKPFELPKDIKLLIDFVKSRPKELFKIMILLEAFGVKSYKNDNGHMELRVPGQGQTSVEIANSVRIKLGKREYDIPADLETIFKRPEGVNIGMLFIALQRKNVKVKVDDSTGIVLGIMIRGILVPFPLTIDLRFQLKNKVYNIPRDLKALIVQLELLGMPSQALHILYTKYGVIPVRNSVGIVIALSFNGRKYPITVEKQTAVALLKKKFLLPRDADKMVAFVGTSEKRIVLMLQALQRAGFMFVPETNGYLQTIQKGAQMITLRMRIQISVKYRKVLYRMPYDLPRLVKVVKGIGSKGLKKLVQALKKVGVIVTKVGSKLEIQFNSIKYTVNG